MYVKMNNAMGCTWAKEKAPLARNVSGILAIITGLAMIAMACALATGIFGGGSYYFIGGALTIGSLIPLLLAAKILTFNYGTGTQTTGDLNTVTTDEKLISTDI